MSPDQAQAAAAPGRWIASPLTDLLWIVGCPLLCLGVLHGLWGGSGWSDRNLYSVMFAFVVTAHHMPACIRAFGEPVIYRRFRARLWTALLFIPAVAIVPFAYGWGVSVLCVVAVFDLWHVAMQQHGLGRIYAAKAGAIGSASARLDLVCILTWYASVVLLSDSWMAGISTAFRNAGLPVFAALPEAQWAWLREAALAVSLGLLLAYLVQARRDYARTGAVPWLKHALHAVAFGVLATSYQDANWYRAQSTQNLFHALQYFFIVWVYGNRGVRRDSLAYPQLYVGLFRNKRGVMRFMLLVLLYGLFFYILRVTRTGLQHGALSPARVPLIPSAWSAEHAMEMLASLSIASLFLHFYIDSFIWKVRSTPVRATLDIDTTGAAAVASPESCLRGVSHAAAYFGLPVLAVVLVGGGGAEPEPRALRQALLHDAQLFPESAAAHSVLGMAALDAGDAAAAVEAFHRATLLAPSYAGPSGALARLARDAGDREDAIAWGLRALQATPEDAQLRHRVALDMIEAGRLGEAEAQLQRALAHRRNFKAARRTLHDLRHRLHGSP